MKFRRQRVKDSVTGSNSA